MRSFSASGVLAATALVFLLGVGTASSQEAPDPAAKTLQDQFVQAVVDVCVPVLAQGKGVTDAGDAVTALVTPASDKAKAANPLSAAGPLWELKGQTGGAVTISERGKTAPCSVFAIDLEPNAAFEAAVQKLMAPGGFEEVVRKPKAGRVERELKSKDKRFVIQFKSFENLTMAHLGK